MTGLNHIMTGLFYQDGTGSRSVFAHRIVKLIIAGHRLALERSCGAGETRAVLVSGRPEGGQETGRAAYIRLRDVKRFQDRTQSGQPYIQRSRQHYRHHQRRAARVVAAIHGSSRWRRAGRGAGAAPRVGWRAVRSGGGRHSGAALHDNPSAPLLAKNHRKSRRPSSAAERGASCCFTFVRHRVLRAQSPLTCR